MKEKKKETRNSSIELLRIIAMMGVICLHYNSSIYGAALKLVTPNSLNQYYLHFIGSLFVCAVNLFIMISAYFLCQTQNRRSIKVLELIKEGKDLSIIAIGKMVDRAIEVANILQEKEIDAEVINSRFLKPMDNNAILKSIAFQILFTATLKIYSPSTYVSISSSVVSILRFLERAEPSIFEYASFLVHIL